jgi:hypothetical protein
MFKPIFDWVTLPARCFIELLKGMAEGPGYQDPSDPFRRRPETRQPDSIFSSRWRAGPLSWPTTKKCRRGERS